MSRVKILLSSLVTLTAIAKPAHEITKAERVRVVYLNRPVNRLKETNHVSGLLTLLNEYVRVLDMLQYIQEPNLVSLWELNVLDFILNKLEVVTTLNKFKQYVRG